MYKPHRLIIVTAGMFALLSCDTRDHATAYRSSYASNYKAAYEAAYDREWGNAYSTAEPVAYEQTRETLVANGEFSYNRKLLATVMVVGMGVGFLFQFFVMLGLRKSPLLEGDIARKLLPVAASRIDLRELKLFQEGSSRRLKKGRP